MSDHASSPDSLDGHDVFDIRCADAIELVTDYLDDALSAPDLVRFESHLAGCDGCTIFVDQVRMTIRLTSATGENQVDLMPSNFELLLAQLRGRANGEGPAPSGSSG